MSKKCPYDIDRASRRHTGSMSICVCVCVCACVGVCVPGGSVNACWRPAGSGGPRLSEASVRLYSHNKDLVGDTVQGVSTSKGLPSMQQQRIRKLCCVCVCVCVCVEAQPGDSWHCFLFFVKEECV